MPRLRALGLSLAVCFTLPATAQSLEVRYEIFWGGFRAAEARLAHADSEALLAVRATGLVNSFTGFMLEAEAARRQFRSHTQSKRLDTLLAVDFTGTPRITQDETRRLQPGEDKEPRPPVPEEMKMGSIDPLSALVSASKRALAGKEGETFVMPVFDGRQRYDVTVIVLGADTSSAGRAIHGTRARIEFKPLAGFKTKSRENWEGASFSVLLDPITQLPARITSESFTVGTVISAVPGAQATGG